MMAFERLYGQISQTEPRARASGFNSLENNHNITLSKVIGRSLTRFPVA